MDTPFKTAALTVCALCAFAADQAVGTDLLNFLRGPRPLTGQDISFIKDRFRGGVCNYIIFSYFGGAKPENDYTPSQPYTVTVTSDAHSFDEQGYARLYIACGGADSPRPVKLRKKGRWAVVPLGAVSAYGYSSAEGERPVGVSDRKNKWKEKMRL